MPVGYRDIRDAGEMVILLSFQSNAMFRYQIDAEELHSNLPTGRNAKKDTFQLHYAIVSPETRANSDRDRGQVQNEKKKRKRRK